MTKPYSIRRTRFGTYQVLNPSGVELCDGCSWRVAADIAQLYNDRVEWKKWAREEDAWLTELRAGYATTRAARAAVKGTP